MSDVTTRPTLPGTAINPTPEEIAQGIILKSYEGTTPENGDWRLIKTGTKLHYEQYFNTVWKKSQQIGSTITDLITLDPEYAGTNGELTGIEWNEDSTDITKPNRNIYRRASTPETIDLGSPYDKLFITAKNRDNISIAYPMEDYQYDMQTSDTETSPVSTSYTFVHTYTPTKSNPFFAEELAIDLVETAKGRLIIQDIADNNRIIYKTVSDVDWDADLGHQIPTGFNYGTIIHPLYLISGREYRITIEFDTPISLKGLTIGPDFIPHSSFKGHYESLDIVSAYSAWEAKVYAKGDIIIEDGELYICNIAGAQITDFPTNASKWDELGSLLTDASIWTRTGTNISPKTTGDNILLPTGSALFLGDAIIERENKTHDPIYLSGQTGLNDLSSSGTYTLTGNAVFQIKIQNIGTPDNFEWKKDMLGSWIGPVAMTGSAQLLQDGISITWATTTGHTNNDEWEINTGHEVHLNEPLHVNDDVTVDGDVVVKGQLRSLSPVKINEGIAIRRDESGKFVEFIDGTDTFGLYNRAGTPEGNIATDKGSYCLDTESGELYVKTTDIVNTGWKQLAFINDVYETKGTTVVMTDDPEILEVDPLDDTKIKIKHSFVLRTIDSSNALDIKMNEITVPVTTGLSHTIPLGTTYWIGIKEIALTPFFELVFNPEYTDFNSATEAIVGRADTSATIPDQLGIVRNSPYVAHDLTRTAYDYMAVRNNTFLISGGNITPTSGAMTYTTEEGQYWRFMTWINTPNRNYGLELQKLQTIYYVCNSTGGFENPSTFEEGYYDNNGVKTAVPADKWAITKVYHFAISNVEGHQRGKQFYDSLHDAQSRKGEEDSPAHPDFTGAALTHLIFIKEGATDADNREEVVFEKVNSNNISSSGDPIVGGLQQSGVIDWVSSDILTINADPTKFDRGEFRIGLVNRETGVRFVRTIEAETGIIVDNLTADPFTFYGYNIVTDSFIQQSMPMDRTTLDNIIPIGRLWHRNKTIIDNAQTMPLVIETSHDYAGQLLAFGALKQSGLNLAANGANKKVDLSEGILEVLGGTSTSRENISNAQPSSAIPLNFTPVHRAVTTSKVIFETFTDEPDYDVYDDGSGTLADLSPNNFGLHYFYIFPFRETVDVFLIRGDESYATLVDAQEGLQQNPIPIPSDLQNGFPFAVVIAKKGTDNLPVAITAGNAVIVSANRFGSFGAGGGGSIGGVTKFIDNTDTPADYVDQAGKFPVVNSAENGLVFTEVESSISILFDNFDLRFFGELGLPNLQTWTINVTGSATVDLVTDIVFGESKDVVKVNDNTADGSSGVVKSLTLEDWEDIQAYGASYGGVSRLDTNDGSNGFFSGLQADGPENPLNAENRRYGVYFEKDGDYLKIEEVGNATNNMTFDGLSGRQLILFDEWFKWETVIPANLSFAIVYVNGVIALTISFRINGGGLGTQATVASGSTGQLDRISYHENFGVTIYKELPNRILSAEEMATNKIIIIIPSGQRDYVITLPDDNPRGIGDTLSILTNNIGGNVALTTQDVNAPQVLFNGFNSVSTNIIKNDELYFTNIVENGNVYQTILSKIETGIADGQMAYWDNAMNRWKYAETSELYWDDTNKRLGVASLGVDGYTNLGDDAPKIKMKKFTGTTASSQGGISNIAHGLTSSKILSVDVTIEYGTDLYISTGYKHIAGYWASKQWASTNISIYNHATESANILSKPFKLLVTYEE